MSRLSELRARRAAITVEMRASLAAAETAARDFTADERTKFDALKAELETIERRESDQQVLDDAERRTQGTPLNGGGASDAQWETRCRSFSLTRAIASAAGIQGVDAGAEREVSTELQRRSGRAPMGIFVPYGIFQRERTPVEQRVMTVGGGAVGLQENILDVSQFIDILRAALVVRRLGATVLSGLSASVDIPRLATSATVGWVAENSALSASDQAYDKVTLSPKHCGGIVELSRNTIMQSSPDIETLVRNDFARILAAAIDSAALVGGGSNQPVGVLSTSGIGDVAMGTNGLAPTYAAVLALIAKLSDANALGGALAFATNGQVVKKNRSVLKTTADTSSNFIQTDPNSLLGYPLAQTSNVPSNLTKGTSSGVASALIFGNWSDLLIGFWSEIDILVSPYDSVAFTKGNILIRAMMTADVQLRHVASFAAIKDVLTA